MFTHRQALEVYAMRTATVLIFSCAIVLATLTLPSASKSLIVQVEKDTDGDTIPDKWDNCPNIRNQMQRDSGGLPLGDVCEDLDEDGISDDWDNCRKVANPDQEDLDVDGLGDACDDDIDGDGLANNRDSCPMERNLNQDLDKDGLDDSCDKSVWVFDTRSCYAWIMETPTMLRYEGATGSVCDGLSKAIFSSQGALVPLGSGYYRYFQVRQDAYGDLSLWDRKFSWGKEGGNRWTLLARVSKKEFLVNKTKGN